MSRQSLLNFLVNNSPFAGKEGKFVTNARSREIGKRIEINVGLRVDFGGNDSFRVYGRGELHVSILLENMRREGYELQVSQPQVIFKEENGQKLEPYEEVVVDTPSEFQGAIIERLGVRAFQMKDLQIHGATVRMVLRVQHADFWDTKTSSSLIPKGRESCHHSLSRSTIRR